MRKILVCQHEPEDDLRQWEPLFQRLDLEADRIDFSREPEARPSLDEAHGLVLLGGSMDVHEARRRPHLAHEMDLVRLAAQKGTPVMGICLGAQLVAKALGGEVRKSPSPEIGWYSLRPQGLKVFQWHAYEFSLPPNSVPLASSARCRNQYFHAGASILATQFHFEIDERTILSWLKDSSLPENRKEKIRRETAEYLPRSLAFGESLWTEFASRLQENRRS